MCFGLATDVKDQLLRFLLTSVVVLTTPALPYTGVVTGSHALDHWQCNSYEGIGVLRVKGALVPHVLNFITPFTR